MTCTHVFVATSENFVPFFRCDYCGTYVHNLTCIDDNGKLECVCGLEDETAGVWP